MFWSVHACAILHFMEKPTITFHCVRNSYPPLTQLFSLAFFIINPVIFLLFISLPADTLKKEW